jgi:hypothetical protein
MKVFISWSGENSKKFAEALRNWLPAVLQLVKPYFTPSDIEKGTRWNSEIAKELESAQVGILCVTRDNLRSDWIMFEAGALSKSLDKAYVCPVLFGIRNADLSGPLKQFQTTEFEKEDFKKLIQVVNNKMADNKLAPSVLDSVFDKWWPELEREIKKGISEIGKASVEPVRTDRDILNEILELSRMAARNNAAPPQRININPKALIHLLETFITLHNENCAGIGGYQQTLDSLKEMSKSIIYFAANYSRNNARVDELFQIVSSLPFLHKEKEPPPPKDDIPF